MSPEQPSFLKKLAAQAPWRGLPNPIRWVVVSLIGASLILLGVVMLILPGPGTVFVLAGLTVLGTEFVWAEVILHKVSRAVRSFFSFFRKGSPSELS